MSLTITTKTRRFTVKLKETECEQLFDQILVGVLKRKPKQEIKQPMPKEEIDCKKTESNKEERISAYKAKGFQYIQCSHCKKENGFSTKEPISNYTCKECGNVTNYNKPLVPLYINCECGGRYFYLTNKTEPSFDVPCLSCGQPIAVQYNEKKGIYETIRG